MSESKGQEIVEKLLTFIEMVSNRKLKFSSIVDMNTGKTSDPTDRMVAAVDAALRAAKVEGLEDVARYCRGECVVLCDDKDRWQKGHNVAAEHIAKYCDRKANEVKS